MDLETRTHRSGRSLTPRQEVTRSTAALVVLLAVGVSTLLVSVLRRALGRRPGLGR